MTYVYRYNPLSSTGRAVRVRSDSPEAAEWPTRKPTRLPAAARTALTKAAGRAVEVGLPAIGVVAAAGKRAIQRAAPVVAKASIVAAVGAAAYLGASYIRDQIVSGATDPEFIISMAALRARRDLQAKLGRALTAEELHQLRDEIARRFTLLEESMKAATPFGLGVLVNLLRRAL